MSRPSRNAPIDASKPLVLTNSVIERFTLSPDADQAFLRDALVPGLKVRVTKSGTKAFVFERKIGQKTTRRTIGAVAVITIDQAREKAREARLSLDEGTDILRQQKESARREIEAPAASSDLTIGTLWPVYLADRKEHWGTRHHQDHEKLMHAGGKKVARGTDGKGVTVPGVLFSLQQHRIADLTPKIVEAWAAEQAVGRPTQARLGQRLLRAFLNWCGEQDEYRELVPAGNLVSTKRVRDSLGKSKTKKDALLREQLAAWFTQVRSMGNHQQAVYFQAMLLTGARPNEVLDLKWDDIDWRWRGLNIRDKVEGDRTIPLPDYLGQQIDSLPRVNKFVFASLKIKDQKMSIPTGQHRALCKRAGIPHVTLHGFRRSFKSLTEWLEIPAGVVAQLQGHKPSATAEKHYTVRPLDLLRVHHQRIENWILEQGGVEISQK